MEEAQTVYRKNLADYPEMMTVPELAEYLRVHPNTAYVFVKSGYLPSIKICRQIRIYREDVRRLFPGGNLAKNDDRI